LLALADPVVVELREWSRIAEDLGAERNRLTNRFREQLWRYFPAILELEADLASEWLLDLWETVPTPHKAVRIRDTTIAKLLKRHRVRRFDAAQLLSILRAPPVRVAAGTTEAASAHIATLITRIRLVNKQLKQAHQKLDVLIARLVPTEEAEPGQTKQHDVEVLASLPGVGRIILATLLAEASDALQRRDYAALRSLTGVAPVTKRSGKSCIVVRRYACHGRLANAMYHWARTAIQHDPTSRSKYAALRSRGHSHARALRSVGDRLLNIACAMLRSGTIFDASITKQTA
jgi:transposase